jgi:hypothetical protein
MAYGHAERNLSLIRQLEAETMQLLGGMDELDPEQSAWLHEVTGTGKLASGESRPPQAAAQGRGCRARPECGQPASAEPCGL